MKFSIQCLFLILLLTGGGLSADVFSLFPFRKGSAAGSGSSGVDNVLHGSLLWTEEVEINGRRLELEVSLVNRTLQEVLSELRGQFKKRAAAVNSNSLLFEIPLDSGARKRYYLVALQGIVPVLQFSLVLPAGFRRNSPANWPSELPLPPGASPTAVMRLPKRKSVYGAFHSSFSPQQTLADVTRSLLAQGWKGAGKGDASSHSASGEVFLHGEKQEIMIVSIQNTSRGCTGSLYLRKLSGR